MICTRPTKPSASGLCVRNHNSHATAKESISAPKEAIVRMQLKATVVTVEVKKPAGKWEKAASQPYGKLVADEDTGMPRGLGFEVIPGFTMLMRDNRDRQVFAKMTGG